MAAADGHQWAGSDPGHLAGFRPDAKNKITSVKDTHLPWKSATEALSVVRSGMRVFVGSGCAVPQLLVEALAARAPEVFDVEVLHILTHVPAPYDTP